MGTSDLTFQGFITLASRKGRNSYSSKKKAARSSLAMLKKDFEKAFTVIRDFNLFLLDEFWEEDFTAFSESTSYERQSHLDALSHFYKINSSLNASISDLSKLFRENRISSLEFFIHACKVFEIARLGQEYPEIIKEAEKNPCKRLLFYAYDPYAAPAVHIICNKLVKHETGEGIRNLGYHSMVNLDRWIQLEKDKMLLEEMMDAYFYGDFKIEFEENRGSFSFILKPKNDHVSKRVKRIKIKEDFRRAHYQYLSKEGLSGDSFFQEIDPFFKTTEGLPTIFTSGLTVTSQTKGTTFLDVGPDFFDEGDPSKSSLKSIELMFKAQFNYQLRLNAQNNFWLSDEVDTSKLPLQLPNGKTIPLSKMILALSAFAAEVPNIEYIRCITVDWPKLGKMALEKKGIERVDIEILEEVQNFLTDLDLTQFPKAQLACLMPNQAKNRESMISWLQEITKLSSDEVEGMLSLLVEQQYGLSPLLFHDNIYYWYPYDFTAHLIPTYFYNYYWKMTRFSHKKGNKNSAQNADTRADLMAKYLACIFREAGYSYVKPEATFKQIDDSRKNRGIDLLAYDQLSNTILSIEIKLSNTPQDSYFKKNRWAVSRIENKGLEQVAHNHNLLTHFTAGKWLQDQFELKYVPRDFKIHHLIATDNFFFDHEFFPYGQSESQRVQVVSIFELQKILHNNDLLEPQSESWVRNEILRIDQENRVQVPESYMLWAKGLQQMLINSKEGEDLFNLMVSFIQENKVEFWDRKTGISIPRLMEIIENNHLWQFFERSLASCEITKELKMLKPNDFKIKI